MSEIKIDSEAFHQRARRLQSTWREYERTEDAFAGVGSILILVGKTDDENPYAKSTALHTWLLGYEFPAMLMLILQDKFYFLTSASKAKHLAALEGGKVPVEILARSKDEEENAKLWSTIIEAMEKAGNRVGVLAKDKTSGPFVDEWNKALTSSGKPFEQVDIAAGLSTTMQVKDETELRTIRTACRATLGVMTGYFVDEMSTIIDDERQITHDKFSALVESKLEDDRFLQTMAQTNKLPQDFDASQLDWCYTPIIQSGGRYDLKASAFSDSNKLHGGVIVASMGLRYKSYCSNIGRTYLIDPNSNHEANYTFLVSLQKKVLDMVREGAVARDIYNKSLALVKSKMPQLESHFTKNVGAGIGIEFRDSSLLLNAKNTRVLKDGMTLNVSVGFADIENPEPKDSQSNTYSLLLIDTVRVTTAAPVVMTDNPRDYNAVSFFFKDDEEAPAKKAAAPEKRGTAKSSVMKSKTRGEFKPADASSEMRRREHQKELHARKQQEGLDRFEDQEEVKNGETKKVIKKYESYKRDTLLPSSVADLKIVVDPKSQSIVVPVFGRPVPYHISTIRNVSKNEENTYTYLRLNFVSPGTNIGKNEDLPFDDPNATFVRSLTFRSKDQERMADIFKGIQDMKKNANKRDQEAKEFADVVQQDHLIEIKNRRPQRLNDVFVRPAIEGTKRVPGELEIHENGLRYQSPLRADHRVDLLFNNIKHLYFQPCDKELFVIIHVHMINPIMIGKRKAKDIQFYREATDIQFDETGNRRRKYRYGDEDELEAEQEERRRRAALNKEFRAFSERISEASQGRLDVDIPFRELGFTGVPFRSNVLCQPTTDSLVQLTEPPFLVVTLSEVEVVHLERIQFGLKNFDMVFVYKDFHRPVVHINSIPMEQVDTVREWLDSVDIAFSEGPLNLNWPTIMKTVQNDPKDFFKTGGWSFLSTDSDDEQDDESDSDESEFEATDEDAESESAQSDESEFGEDEDASDDDAGSEEAESGEDWDELEDKAKKEDSRHGEKRKR